MHRLNVVGFLVGLLIATPLLAAEPAIEGQNSRAHVSAFHDRLAGDVFEQESLFSDFYD